MSKQETKKPMHVVFHPEISKWRMDAAVVDKKLAKDMKENGQYQDINARLLPNGDIEVIGGHRRFIALQSIGVKPEDMGIKIRENVSDQEAVLMAYKENKFRQDLSNVEEGRAYRTMVNMGMSIEEIALRNGLKEAYIKNRLNLLSLPEKIVALIEMGKIEMSYAEALLMLNDAPDVQTELARRIAQQDYSIRTAANAKEMAKEYLKAIKVREEISQKYGPCPKCGSMLIGPAEHYWSEDKAKLACLKCGHTFHKDTKEPWKLVEIKKEAKGLGLEVKVVDGVVNLSPAEMAKILQDQKDKMEALQQGTFRSAHTPEEILTPLLSSNVMRITVNGDKIEVKLKENCGLHFSARGHAYDSGERSQIKVTANYWDEDNSNSVERNVEAVRKFLLNMKRE